MRAEPEFARASSEGAKPSSSPIRPDPPCEVIKFDEFGALGNCGADEAPPAPDGSGSGSSCVSNSDLSLFCSIDIFKKRAEEGGKTDGKTTTKNAHVLAFATLLRDARQGRVPSEFAIKDLG
jgi:hypothetical protein